MKQKDEVTVYQFGVTEAEGKFYLVLRDFYLETCLGPATVVKKGSRALLSPKMGKELFFMSKVEPESLSETFEVLRPFRTVQNGEWLDLAPGDIVRLNREEALPLLRQQVIREKREGGTE